MSDGEEVSELDCSLEDFDKAEGFSSLGDYSRARKDAKKLYELVDGGMHLPSVARAIAAHPSLDDFIVREFDRYRDPKTRQFGENLFSVTGRPGAYKVGHRERYCGPTYTMLPAVFRAKSGGIVVGLAHTHPYFRGTLSARALNRDGAQFGPGDWTPLIAFNAPFYLYTPNRQTHVMEYDGKFVTVRKVGGKARKWRVSKK